jgi:tetraacyldisaccharide 4'-kinase
MTLNTSQEVLLVSGIANPLPLKKYLQDASKTYYEILYRDHHIFSIDDWNDIIARFNNIPTENKIILTTEKDAVRLIKFGQALENYPVFVIPIEIQFLFNSTHQFTDIISKFITDFSITT